MAICAEFRQFGKTSNKLCFETLGNANNASANFKNLIHTLDLPQCVIYCSGDPLTCYLLFRDGSMVKYTDATCATCFRNHLIL